VIAALRLKTSGISIVLLKHNDNPAPLAKTCSV
jgi:hypothetical protein